MIDHSEQSFARGGYAVLRWVLAPLGATAALGLAVLATFLISGLFATEVENEPSARILVTYVVAVVSSLVAWTWAGASIAPPQHHRLALGLFSVPAVLFALMIVLIIGIAIAVPELRTEVDPEAVALAVGCVLACGGILMLDGNIREALPAHLIKRIVLVGGSIAFLTAFLSQLAFRFLTHS